MINPKRVEDENLQEEIMCLAEDIIDLNEKSEELDNHILTMLKLMNETTMVLHDTIEIVKDHEEKLQKLGEEIKEVDNGWIVLFWFLVIWNFILTCVLWYHVF